MGRCEALVAAARPPAKLASIPPAGPEPELWQSLSTVTVRLAQTSFAGQPTSLTQAVTSLAPSWKGARSVSMANSRASLPAQGANRRAGPPGTMSQAASAEAADAPLTDTRQRQTPPPTSVAAMRRSKML